MEMDGGMDGLGGSRCGSDAFLGELLESIRQRIKPESRRRCQVYPGPVLRRKRRPTVAVDVLRQSALFTADVPNPTETGLASVAALYLAR